MSPKSKARAAQEADQYVYAALQAWLADDLQGVALMVKQAPDPVEFGLSALLVAKAAIERMPDPEPFLASVRALADNPPQPQTQTERARKFLRAKLADRQEHLLTDLWDEAVATGVLDGDDMAKAKWAMRNAASQLGVVSIPSREGNYWRMSDAAIERQELIDRAKRLARGQRASR